MKVQLREMGRSEKTKSDLKEMEKESVSAYENESERESMSD